MSAWSTIPLGYCVSEVRRKNVEGRQRNLLSLSYGNIIRRNIDTADGLLPESFDNYNIVQPGDTVLRLTDLQNDQRSLRVGLVQENGIITSAYVTLRPGGSVEARYFNYFLKNLDFRKEFYALGAGVRQSLKFDELRRLPLPLPTVDLQRSIADYLDIETARIDALIEKKQRMIELLEERFRSHVEAMIQPSNGDQSVAIGKVLQQKITDGPHESPEFVDDGIPFLSIEAIKNDHLDFSGCRMISGEAHREYARKCDPRRDDVLLAKTGATIGKVVLVETDRKFSIWSPLALIRPRQDLFRSRYVWYWLRIPTVQSQIRVKATQSTQPNISMPDIATLHIPLRDLEEQDSIVAQLDKFTLAGTELTLRLSRQIDLLVERRQALITAAVTGELEIPGAAA